MERNADEEIRTIVNGWRGNNGCLTIRLKHALHLLPSRLRLLEELETRVPKVQRPFLEDVYLPRPSNGELDSVSDGDDECRENGKGEGVRDNVGVADDEESEEELPGIIPEYSVLLSARSDKGKTTTLDGLLLKVSPKLTSEGMSCSSSGESSK